MNLPRMLAAAMFVATSVFAASAFGGVFETPIARANREGNARMWAQAAAQLRRQILEFNEEIAQARSKFWATYPDKPGAAEAAQRFSDLLRAKDIYFLTVVLSNGMGDLGGVGVFLDGQIRPSAGPEFEEWVNAVKARMGMFGQSDMLRWWTSTWNAAEAAPTEYKKYVRERDWWEFDHARRVPAGCEKPENYGGYLYFRYKFTRLAKKDPRASLPGENAEATYNKMVELFGKQRVYDAAKKVFDAPKTEWGSLVVTTKAPVKFGPSGEIDEPVSVMEQAFTLLTDPSRYTTRRTSTRHADNTVPLPEGVIGVFSNPLTALELLVTKDDDRRYLLFYLSGQDRSFIGGISDPITDWALAEILYRRLVLAFGEKEVLEVARVVRTATKRMTDISVMDPEAIGARRGQPFHAFEDILARKNPRGYVRSALISREKLDSPAAVDSSYKKLVAVNNEDAVLEAARKMAAKPENFRPSLVWGVELENLMEWLRNPPLEAPAGPLVDYLEYLAWKGFSAGAKVSYAQRTWQVQRSRAGQDRLAPGPVDYNYGYQLQSINDQQVLLWFTEGSYGARGQKLIPRDTEVGYPAKFDPSAARLQTPPTTTADTALTPKTNFRYGAEPDSTPIQSGEEVIEIDGKRIAARWQSKSYRFRDTPSFPEEKDCTLVVKVWTSDAVPTGLVRRTEEKIWQPGPPSRTRPYGNRVIVETSLESFTGSRPGIAAPDPSRPVTAAYVPAPSALGGAASASTPTPVPQTKVTRPPEAKPVLPIAPPREAPAQPRTVADPFALSQRFSAVTMRATQAKGGLAQLEYRPAGQGVQIPANIRDARDRVEARLQAAVLAIQKGDANETEQILRSAEADLAVIEKFLKR